MVRPDFRTSKRRPPHCDNLTQTQLETFGWPRRR